MTAFVQRDDEARSPVPDLLPRLLAGLAPGRERLSLDGHRAVHGPLPPVRSTELIDAVDQSGLRGRGGADFPTALKLRAVAARRRGRSVVLVNGSETEPLSRKDRLLLAALPHLVLDGATLAAAAVGARRILIRLPEDRALTRSVEAALSERSEAGLDVSVVPGPGGYVSGEESAAVSFVQGGRPVPQFTPPRPYERGVDGRPTFVSNPETLAQLALVARHGPQWFRRLGTDADPGSVLVTIAGAVERPGVYEMAFGTPMQTLLRSAGGELEPLQALLIGGYFGTWIDARRGLGLRLARAELQAEGCGLGSGVIFALGRSACGVHESARLVKWLAAQSARQCGPCSHGLRAIADTMSVLADGAASLREASRVASVAAEIRGRGACHHPDGVGRLAMSALEVFGTGDGHRASHCPGTHSGLALPRMAAA
jgi:NADH:ubiquinone oxidoreductase subunit F (NADH-binding)